MYIESALKHHRQCHHVKTNLDFCTSRRWSNLHITDDSTPAPQHYYTNTAMHQPYSQSSAQILALTTDHHSENVFCTVIWCALKQELQ